MYILHLFSINTSAPQETLTDDNIHSNPIETPLENLAHRILFEQKRIMSIQHCPSYIMRESLEQDTPNRKSDNLSKATSLFTDFLGVTCSVK